MPSESSRERLSQRVFTVERKTFLRLCEAVNTPRALACYMLASADEWDQYLDLPRPDFESPTFADDYMCTEAMSKNPLMSTSHNRRQTAIMKWREAEQACRLTNECIQAYEEGRFLFPRDVYNVVQRTRDIIRTILGRLTPEKLAFAERMFRFGPGATSSCSHRDVVISRKMTSRLDVSPGLYPYWRSLLHGTWAGGVTEINLRAYNKVTFVPKSAKTDRAIAIEPHANIYCQLGVGALLRKQLRRAGLDLDSQASRNRTLASRAHSHGLATIDLSSASDTVARKLVRFLLPADWAHLLETLRVEYSLLDDEEVYLEKFSSMGNGYTFELETLIFWALALACGSPSAVAFGDDIIVDAPFAGLLIRTLNTLGFSVNEKKTFTAGVFFESCGTDWHNGMDVRPIFFKGKYHDYPSCCIRICNKVRRYAARRYRGFGCDIRFLDAWRFCISRSKPASRTAIPEGYGDDGIVRNFDEAALFPEVRRAKYGHAGWRVPVWRAKPRISNRTVPLGAYLGVLNGYLRMGVWQPHKNLLDSTDRPDGVLSDKNVEFERMLEESSSSTMVVPTWLDLGPWR